MDPMYYYVIGGVILLVFAIVLVAVLNKKSKPVNISVNDVPDYIMSDIYKRIKGISIDRVSFKSKTNTYRFYGKISGKPIRSIFHLNQESHSQQFVKIEIQPEIRLSYRKLRNVRKIGKTQIPKNCLAKAKSQAADYSAPFDDILTAHTAKSMDRTAYSFHGKSKDWIITANVLLNGEPLEVILEKQSNKR